MTSVPLSERAFSEIVKRGSRLIGSGGARLVQLDESRLLDEARRRTGLSDFGAGDFGEPLRRLLRSWEDEAGLTLLGRIAARQDTLRLLVNRLRMQEDRRRRPEIGAQQVLRPLFVTGLPRTGTTLLHGLLAHDPAHRAPLNWEVMSPSPPPERALYRRDPRIRVAERQLRWFYRLAPGFRRIHPVGARLPEECLIITSHSFLSFQFQTSHHVPSYQTWLEAHDLRESYAMHRLVLQHLQWHGPRGRWVLKAPAHLFGLEALFAIYPDASVIFTHRDPLEVVPSMASLHTELRSTFSDTVDPVAIGAEVTRRWADGIGRALRARDAGIAPADRFADVQYTNLVRDPIGTVRRLYRHFGGSLTPAAESRMRAFLAESPKDKHGTHHYSLAQFGFDADEERQRYRAYRERFGF
jgi:hypothetical protein